MRSRLHAPFQGLVCALSLFASAASFAQTDAPLSYPGEDDEPRSSRSTRRRRDVEAEEEKQSDRLREKRREAARSSSLAGYDDPYVGLGVEALAGIYLLDASNGAFANVRPAFGARLEWEIGRAIGGEFWRDRLFVDLTGVRTSISGGTDTVQSRFTLNNLTLAPAVYFAFGDLPFGFYAQVGGGVSFQSSVLSVDGVDYSVAALKPLIQYGVGLRGAISLGDSGLRFTFRTEAMRFRRDYFDDSLFAATAGILF